MNVSLWYFDGCPHWRIADDRLAVIAAEHPEMVVTRHRVDSEREAERVGFRGSPSFVVDGVDLFPVPDAPMGRSCRLYPTPGGLAGSPTVGQLRVAPGGAGEEA